MNITDAQADWARDVRKTLANQGFRVSGDLRNEKIGYKIREHTLQSVPYLLVVGDREKENGAVAVRTRSGEDLGTMSVADFAARLADGHAAARSEEHTFELQSLMRISYAVFCLKKKIHTIYN